MSGLRFQVPPKGSVKPNDAEKDPIGYYYHPWIGWLFRHRLQMGLNLLPSGGDRILEVGVGSGVLVPTLTARYREYTGTDLLLAPGLDKLVAPTCKANFMRADLLANDLPADHFDVVVCFSVLEHIADSTGAARGLARALAPGGTLVCGYPMVNHLMTRAFAAIGYKQIDDDHVSKPSKIAAALATVLKPAGRIAFPPAMPVDASLYQCTAWTKPAAT